ncbi:MAG: ASCH domain-containing protein [Candidatus Bathyarchaeia archaeon]
MNDIVFTLQELQVRLQTKKITQTIRSKTQLNKHKWAVGSKVSVKWRNQLIGRVQVVLIETRKIRNLTEGDAELTGFDSREELLRALKRFFGRLGETRFWENKVYRIRFKWL